MSVLLPDTTTIIVPKPSEVRAQWLRDLEFGLVQNGSPNPQILPGSETYIRGTALDNFAQAIYFNVQIASDNSSELTATGTALDNLLEAAGLDPIEPSPAAGKIVVELFGATPSVTFTSGLELKAANGKYYKVFGTQTAANNGTLNIIAKDTGAATNLAAGSVLRWTNPPINVQIEATTVDVEGLTGGFDEETAQSKQDRILNKRKNIPAGGNPGFLKNIADKNGAVESSFVYSTLPYGRGSAKVVVISKLADPDFSREVEVGQVDSVLGSLLAEYPAGCDITVQSASNENTDVAVRLDLSDVASASGGRIGWANSAPFPLLVPADNGKITVSQVLNSTTIRLSANTGVTPTIGHKIAWWSKVKRKFIVASIVQQSGSAGAWVLALDVPLTTGGDTVAVGDYISPAAVSIVDYGASFLASTAKLGPGENVAISSSLDRRRRFPAISSSEWATDLTVRQLSDLTEGHDEIANAEYSYVSKTTPTVPIDLELEPNILRLVRLGFYPI